jgi:hypothetical protein
MARYDQDLLDAALAGYEVQAQAIRRAIAELQSKLKGRKVSVDAGGVTPARKNHRISAEGRRRIAEAQKARWSAQKKASGATAKKSAPKAVTPKKRKLTAEYRAALIERLKKARAARAAKRTAGERLTF